MQSKPHYSRNDPLLVSKLAQSGEFSEPAQISEFSESTEGGERSSEVRSSPQPSHSRLHLGLFLD